MIGLKLGHLVRTGCIVHVCLEKGAFLNLKKPKKHFSFRMDKDHPPPAYPPRPKWGGALGFFFYAEITIFIGFNPFLYGEEMVVEDG